jgi:hypothetical protein
MEAKHSSIYERPFTSAEKLYNMPRVNQR